MDLKAKPFKNWKKAIKKMKIGTETPEKLSDSAIDVIISVWNRKPRKIVV